jgi:hypothetical protein
MRLKYSTYFSIFYGRLSTGIVVQNRFSAILPCSIICCIKDLKYKKAAVR